MSVVRHLLLAAVLWGVGFALFGRFVAPRWKVAGTLLFYLAVTALLSATVGGWALVWIVGHPLPGVAGHVRWCRQHRIDRLTCRPRERCLALRPWATADGFGPRHREGPRG